MFCQALDSMYPVDRRAMYRVPAPTRSERTALSNGKLLLKSLGSNDYTDWIHHTVTDILSNLPARKLNGRKTTWTELIEFIKLVVGRCQINSFSIIIHQLYKDLYTGNSSSSLLLCITIIAKSYDAFIMFIALVVYVYATCRSSG
jgi:hypothetical protein